MATDNTHPGTNVKGIFDKIIAFFTGNPIFAILSSLVMLAFILPPRSRKYRRKKSGNPGRRRKSRKKTRTGTLKIVGRKRLKKAGLINNPGNPGRKTKTRRSGPARTMPARFIGAKKGTQLMTEKMDWMRSKR